MRISDWLPEFKVSAETDEDLMRYFLQTSAIEKILNQKKWLVLGRKGSGKTAIFEFLKSKNETPDIQGASVISLNFKDYPWPIHKLYKESMEGELSAYQISWKYLIYTTLLTHIIKKSEEQSVALGPQLKQIKSFLEQIYTSPLPSLMEIIKSKVTRMKTFALPGGNAGDEFKLSLGSIELDELSQSEELKSKLRSNVFQITNFFEKVLKEHSKQFNIIISLDQLDENWLTGEIEEYSRILINLINVCRGIGSDPQLSKSIKVCLFLRTDIYETLKFNDKTKVFQDGAVEIRWDEELLNKMFFERIERLCPDKKSLDSSKKTDSIFNVSFVRHGATPFKHIARRTFYRPRDVVVYLNKVREHNLENASSGLLYSSEDLYGAEKLYSINVYGELIDEWAIQKPELEKLLSVLQRIKYQTFTFSEFVESYETIFNIKDQRQVYEQELQFLFKNSIVGQKGRGRHWEYICNNHYLNIDYSKEFHSHSALKSRLSITESRSTSDSSAENIEE